MAVLGWAGASASGPIRKAGRVCVGGGGGGGGMLSVEFCPDTKSGGGEGGMIAYRGARDIVQ